MEVQLNGKVEILHCPTCGIAYGISKSFVDRRMEDGQPFTCPAGHSQMFRPTTAEILRQEKDQLEQKVQSLVDRVNTLVLCEDRALRRLSAARGQVTRAKRRVADGRCPCCGKTVDDLRAHMQAKHPEYSN